LFEDNAPPRLLEKIPFKFSYEFRCDEDTCKGHTMMCSDWEMAESWRRWKDTYGDDWESKFRMRYEQDMIQRRDTHFYVGTVNKHPDNWIIVGLFYPPPVDQPDLFIHRDRLSAGEA
jgi:hypothetical protein